MTAKKQVEIVFKNRLEPEIYKVFLTEKFCIRLNRLIHPNRQKEVIKELIKDGLIKCK